MMRSAWVLPLFAAVAVSACHKGGKPGDAPAPLTRALSEPPPAPDIAAPPPPNSKSLAVVAARPKGGELTGTSRPTITFNKPVVALATLAELGAHDPAASIRLEPKLAGRWHWLGTSTVEFWPEAPPALSTEYTVTVPAGLKGVDGTALEADYTFAFTTPVLRVTGVGNDERPNACRWARPDSIFTLRTNQPVVDPGQHVHLKLADGTEVPLSVSEEKPTAKVDASSDARDALAYRDRTTRYRLAPQRPLPMATTFTLALDESAHGTEGPLPGQPSQRTCQTPGPMVVERVTRCGGDQTHCPYGPLELTVSNPLAHPKELLQKLHIEPSVKLAGNGGDGEDDEPYTWNDGRSLSVRGAFKPGQTYRVTIDAGVHDYAGQTTAAPFTAQVHLDDLEPSLFVASDHGLLELAGDGALPVQVTNLNTLQVKLWKLTPAEFAVETSCGSSDHAGGDCPYLRRAPDQSLSLPLTYPRNEPRLHGVDLRAALGGQKGGLVLVRIESPELRVREGYEPARVIAQITDLAVHAKPGAVGGAVWVTSLASGKPVAGAKLRVIDASGATRAEAVCDQDGLAALPPLAGLLGESPVKARRGRSSSGPDASQLFFVAEAAGDLAIASMSADRLQADDFWHTFEVPSPRLLGTVYADRGIYRPGDTVHLAGVVRKTALDGAVAVTSAKLTAQVIKPGGGEEPAQPLTLTRYGTFRLDYTVPKDTRLGTYRVTVKEDDSSSLEGEFQVAEYRAPQFRVDVLAGSKDLISGAPLQATVSARYLFGGAMSDAQARWTVTGHTVSFSPPNTDGFSVGERSWWWDGSSSGEGTSQLAAGQGAMDKKGELAIALPKVEAQAGKATEITVEAEVQDLSRQTVAGRAAVLVHPADFYLALGEIHGFARAGEALKLPVLAVKPNGERVAQTATVRLVSRSWHSVRKKGVNGVYASVSEPVETEVGSCTVKTGSEPQECALTPNGPGYFLLRAEAKDGAGRTAHSSTSVYAFGPGAVAWESNDSARIDVLPDKAEYAVGDTAHLLVKSPYPECEALVTVEREGVAEKRHLHLTGQAATLDVPISASMVPNLYVGVVLVRGRVASGGTESGDDPGRPSVRVGYAKLPVGLASKRLSVKVATDKAQYQPRETVQVDVAVAGPDGQPHPAEVQLYAVDHAVLQLTGYQVPDVLGSFFPERPLSVDLAEPIRNLIHRQRFGEKGEVSTGGGGGGGPSGPNLRTRFVTTVLWKNVEVDASGHAKVSFELPDNLTTFRIMAVAVDQKDLAGKAQAEIKVALPLLVLPALPRVARLGDELEAGVVVHTNGLSPGKLTEIKVTAEVSGGLELAKGEPTEKSVSMEDGSGREVRFKLRGARPGLATLRFRATAGSVGDAVEQKVPVLVPIELESVATYADTDGKIQEGLTPPDAVMPGVGGLTLSLSSTALGGLDEGMRQLVEYPYGCVEQLSSRLVPFVALREVARTFGVEPGRNQASAQEAANWNEALRALTERDDGAPPENPDQVVTDTVAKIQKLQLANGGFTYWPSGDCAYAWPSVYATLALHRAREVGYEVDGEVMRRAQSFLQKVAAGEASCPYERISTSEQVFALDVLARMGSAQPARYEKFFVDRDQLPAFTRAQLADAMFVGHGRRGHAEQLLQELLDNAKETAHGMHIEEVNGSTGAPLFSSDTRTSGMVLQTLVDAHPEHPYVSKLAHGLLDARKGGAWRTTQEGAFALIGLTEVVRAREREAPDFTARVKLGDKDLASQAFHGRSLKIINKKIGIDELATHHGLTGKAKPLPFTFEVEGKGRLFYGALLRYAPQMLPKEPRDQGLFVQRWFEPYEGGGKAATTFQAGELVRVRLRVGTRDQRDFVAINIPLPSGLEAVDTSLATTRRAHAGAPDDTAGSEDAGGEGGSGDAGAADDEAPWYSDPFAYTEKRDDRVVYFADHLPPGVHAASFVARATTPGTYVLPPAHAEEMYTPEVFGRTESGTLTVVAAAPVASR